jgi:16S rRNA C967 or C1407 C5-methylase (RsmB/RsmF family)
MKSISYLDMVKDILNESEFLQFEKCYNNPVKKSIKILNHRWYKNNKSDLHDIVESILSQERDFSEPDFSYNWNKYNDVLFATRKENLKSASLWSHYLHQAGLIYVQEMAASLSVQMFGVEEWDYVLDMCAAPWGKSIQIADRLTDWSLISNEIDQWRKKALESNLHRCGIFNVWVINQDWCIIWDKFPETFNKVLVDAPCSWEWMQYKSDKKVRQRDEKKSKKLSDLQIQLLISWLKSLKVWWELVYSTCTTNVLENEYVVSEVLKEHSDKIELLEIPLKEKSDWITTRHWNEILSTENAKKVARLWPHVQKTWGFFIARFRKNQSFWTQWRILGDIQDSSAKASEWQMWENLSNWWISPIPNLDFFVSKYTVNIAAKSLIQLHFESKIPNIEIWLPIFKIVKDNKNQTEKLIPLVWIVQTFGHLATKNVLEITDEQLKSLMEKRDLIDDRLIDYEWNFVILRWNWVGVWLVSVQKWIWKNKCF